MERRILSFSWRAAAAFLRSLDIILRSPGTWPLSGPRTDRGHSPMEARERDREQLSLTGAGVSKDQASRKCRSPHIYIVLVSRPGGAGDAHVIF
jgi:hypothetical protein